MPMTERHPSDDDAVSIDIAGVLDSVTQFRAATAWSGGYVEVPPVTIGQPAADAANDRASFLLRNLPRRYSEQMASSADAVTQGAVDAATADGSAGGD